MRIRITGAEIPINLVLPTKMIFSRPAVKIYLYIARKYAGAHADQAEAAFEKIPDELLLAACREICRVKDRYGSWELVDIHSADGEHINITL